MARSPVLLLVGVSTAGLAALAISPLAAAVLAAVLVVVGVVIRARSDRVLGLGLAGTGGVLFLAAVLVLALVDADQDEPIILGPDTGLIPGG